MRSEVARSGGSFTGASHPTATPPVEDVSQKIPAPENKKFYPALDGLRAIAVLMVFFQHYLGSSTPFLNWGWAGVDFFFVLSGFLITGILYDTRNTLNRFRNFYMRRTLRIFPLYYGVLLAGLALAPIFHWRWHPAWILWPLYLGNYARFIWLADWLHSAGALEHLNSTIPFHHPFLLFLGHFWSLCVEEQFYLVWPLLVFVILDRARLRNLCLTVCVLCLAARIACVFYVPQSYLNAELLYRLTPLRADALLLGGALALILRGPESRFVEKLARPAFVSFVLGFFFFQLAYRHAVGHLYYPVAGAPILDTLGYTLIDLFSAIVILISLKPGGLFFRAFTIKPLRQLGKVSYGFYVFHDIPHVVYGLLVIRTIGQWTTRIGTYTAIVAFCGTLILSFLSFRYFESPFLRLKQRYTPG